MAGKQHTDNQALDVFVSLHEAARAYNTSVGALRTRARSGDLRGYKVRGSHGREWRVSLRSLQAAGFSPRVPADACAEEHARVQELEVELSMVSRLLADERRRADRADQELGHALLESGRLRSQLNKLAGTSTDELRVSTGGASRSAHGREVPEQR